MMGVLAMGGHSKSQHTLDSLTSLEHSWCGMGLLLLPGIIFREGLVSGQGSGLWGSMEPGPHPGLLPSLGETVTPGNDS